MLCGRIQEPRDVLDNVGYDPLMKVQPSRQGFSKVPISPDKAIVAPESPTDYGMEKALANTTGPTQTGLYDASVE
jgi:hypothetical protein